MFQGANVAGVNETSEIEETKKEWEEKGVGSKYFKQFSENAPVVLSKDSENYNYKSGEKVVVNVFHGTQTQRLRNDEFKNKNSEYFFTNKTESVEQYGDNIYE